MPIDRKARQTVREIAAGADPQVVAPDAHHKTVSYGLFSRLLRHMDFTEEQPELHKRQAASCMQVALRAGMLLTAATVPALNEIEMEPTRSQLQSSLDRLTQQRQWSQETMQLHKRLTDGIETAKYFEATTLRTIRQLNEFGQPISRQGLYDSFRVPFKLATNHITEIDLSVDKGLQYGVLADGEAGHVIDPKFVEMDTEIGLRFRGEPPKSETDNPILDAEPHIGCPATMVKDLIKAFHVVSADIAVESGLVQVCD